MAKYTVVSVSLNDEDAKKFQSLKKADVGGVEIFRAGMKVLSKKVK